MIILRSRVAAAGCAALALTGFAAGCGSSSPSKSAGATRTGSQAEMARALSYAHAVNLRAGDLPGYSAYGSESIAPDPAAGYGLGYWPTASREYDRCRGGVPAGRVATVVTPEYSGGHGRHGAIVRSTVELWPTARLADLNATGSHSARGRTCLVSYLTSVQASLTRKHEGGRIGPFTVTIARNPLPGVQDGFLTTINETRLRRDGSVLAHIYRDVFGFVTGTAEVSLQAVGFGDPVPVATEARLLQTLLTRVRASAPPPSE